MTETVVDFHELQLKRKKKRLYKRLKTKSKHPIEMITGTPEGYGFQSEDCCARRWLFKWEISWKSESIFFLNLYARVLVGFILVTSRLWYNIQVFQRVGPLIKTLRVLHAVGEHMTLKKNKKNLLITLINGKWTHPGWVHLKTRNTRETACVSCFSEIPLRPWIAQQFDKLKGYSVA